MSGNRRIRRWAALGVGLLLAGALASVVVASRLDDGSELSAAIDDAAMTRVADIEAADGMPSRGVFVQLTKTGHLCVWEAPFAGSPERGGGCNSIDDPLNGSVLSATLSYDGGPAVSDVRSASVFGLAAAEVARASVLMSDGTSRAIRLKKAKVGSDEFQAFGHRFKNADLKRGIGPISVIAYDAAGTELGRQPTGIGG
jgi:hypothetical protein